VFGFVRKKENHGFLVTGLPRLQESVSRCQRRNVVVIDHSLGVSATGSGRSVHGQEQTDRDDDLSQSREGRISRELPTLKTCRHG